MKNCTDLQDLYDSVLLKIDSTNLVPSMLYALIKPAIGKCKTQLNENTKYILTDSEEYTGYFCREWEDDEIELVALQMAIDYYTNNDLKALVRTKRLIGTKDFNRLPDKKEEMQTIQAEINKLEEQRKELWSNMNKY